MVLSTLLLIILGRLVYAECLPTIGIDGFIGIDVREAMGAAGIDGMFYSVDAISDTSVREMFLEQRLDHFDRQQSRMFKQRYFINRNFWGGSGSGAPVFLCVGGEGPPIDSSILSESVHCNDMVELAPSHQALLVAVEHRYYGKSNPGEDWATESLRWLSSQQALADLAAFRGHIVDEEGLTGQEKWVTWGDGYLDEVEVDSPDAECSNAGVLMVIAESHGSYPGMLAGWARLKYPHLFHAAVSSSSPLQAQLDFPQYAEVVRDALATSGNGVGGSEACAVAVETGHAAVGELIKTEAGRQELVTTFNLCKSSCLEDGRARIAFAGDGVVVLPIQENDPACDGTVCNIKAVCEIMTDERGGSEVQRLAALRKTQRKASGKPDEPCEVFPPLETTASFDADRGTNLLQPLELREMLVSHVGRASDPSDPERAWLYQTCTEFGFYQTCEVGTRCPYPQGLHTLDVDLQMCEEAFGISPDQVREQVRLTNLYYGGIQPSGSRVIFPNGAIDPWHALGVLVTPMPGLPAIYVEGASHHFWTHPSKPTDSREVVRAREVIWNQVTEWLGEED